MTCLISLPAKILQVITIKASPSLAAPSGLVGHCPTSYSPPPPAKLSCRIRLACQGANFSVASDIRNLDGPSSFAAYDLVSSPRLSRCKTGWKTEIADRRARPRSVHLEEFCACCGILCAGVLWFSLVRAKQLGCVWGLRAEVLSFHRETASGWKYHLRKVLRIR